MFESLFSWAGASVLVNIGLAIAGALGWKHAKSFKTGLRSILKGVETVLSRKDATEQKEAKDTLKAQNLIHGAEHVVNKELRKLNLSKGNK